MKIYKKIFHVFFMLAVLGGCIFVLLENDFFRKKTVALKTANSKVPPVRVITRPVVTMNNSRIFEAIGTGKAQKSIWVYPAATEEVTLVKTQAGQLVAKGDLLVQLDDRQEKLAIQLAKVELENTLQLLRRYEKTQHDRVISTNELESTRLAVEAAKLKLKQAELALSERKVLAAFGGVVGIPRIDLGDRVNPSTILMSLDDRSVIHVDFDLPEVLASYISQGMKTKLTTPAFPEKILEGIIAAVESRFDPQGRTVKIRVEIVNTEDLLRPGMSFSIHLKIRGYDHPAVPEISLKWGRDGSYVWIIRDQKAQQVPARVIARTQQLVLVDASIDSNDAVVIEGTQRLRPGREVITNQENSEMREDNEQIGQ